MIIESTTCRGGARVFAGGGGGAKWQNVSLSTALALKKALSGGGGGGLRHIFFSTKHLCGIIITIMA